MASGVLEILATLTDEARRRDAACWQTGKSFKIIAFALSTSGHDPSDPRIALSPDTSLIDCQSVIFGPKPVSSVSNANDFCPIWDCYLAAGEAVTQFSSLCLIAQLVYSPIPSDPELDDSFLFALVNFPLRTKVDLEEITYRVGVQR